MRVEGSKFKLHILNSFANIYISASTCDFQQCGILTNIGSDEPMKPLY